MQTKVLTQQEFIDLVYGGGSLPLAKYVDSINKIRFCSFEDICMFGWFDEKHSNSLRYVVSYDSEHIYGVLKFAWWSGSNHYSIGYCSTNTDFVNKGICSSIVNLFCKYFSSVYPHDFLNISQYTVNGWKYLRGVILKSCIKNNISFNDNIIGYFDKGEDYADEYYILRDLSIKIVGREDF